MKSYAKSEVVLVDAGAHGKVSLKRASVMLQTMSRYASLVEFRFANPEVHVVHKLASDAVQLTGPPGRVAQTLYLSHASCVA
jgi:hypothetical protein